MMQFWVNLCMSLLMAAILFGSAATPGFAAQCLDGPSVQAAISSKQIKSWPTVKALAGIPRTYREVGTLRVCDEGGAPYYEIGVTSPTGDSKQLRINAVTGQQQ